MLAHFWYLDDGTLIGDLASLRECMRHLVPRLAAVGSVIDTQKTHILGPGAPDSRSLDSLDPSDHLSGLRIIPFIECSGVEVLGCPLSKPGSTS